MSIASLNEETEWQEKKQKCNIVVELNNSLNVYRNNCRSHETIKKFPKNENYVEWTSFQRQ